MDYEQKLVEWLENIANVASENVPLFVEQYSRYTIVSNSITVALIVVMLTFLTYIFSRMIFSKDQDINDMVMAMGIFTFGLVVVGIPYCIYLCQQMVLAYVCPVMHVIKSLK